LLERVAAINIETMETAAAMQNLDRTPAERDNAMGARQRCSWRSQFCSKWWQFGAPRPMKMGTIRSPQRYDAAAGCALRPHNPG
jgi:hypothetical protein